MAGILKVDTIQNANADNIITQTNSTTLTIGASGDTVTLAAGATSSGFGRTGTVNWDTTKKTSGFTAVNGVGYFCDTTSTAFTATLPLSPSAGDIVALSDYTGTFATNNLTIGRNGSNIRASATDLILNVNNQTVTLIYVDATEGWNVVQESNNITNFVVATGGTILTCGDFKTHVFTGPGSFVVSSAGNPLGSNSIEYLVVAGGGSGGGGCPGGGNPGGGGAGGYRQNYPSPTTAGLPVIAQSYPITVGGGGTTTPTAPAPGNASAGNSGNPSIFSTITSTGGGGGGAPSGSPVGGNGKTGGSGGGAGYNAATGGAGNTPPTSPSQGNNGGNSIPGGVFPYGSGGGGGAGGTGSGHVPAGSGPGGIGSPIATTFFGPTSPSYGTPGPAPGRYFAGGGGGGAIGPLSVVGGNGGAGGGATGGSGNAATTNTGGGGGGSSLGSVGTAGGSGIVVIRYKFK